nr:hypothetical protein [Tanacetum cinerariifolium]
MTRDPAPVAADFNARDYATLVTHPSQFQKFLQEFLCLVGLSRHYTLDEETYPRFLHKNIEGGDGSLCFHSYFGSYQIVPDYADNVLETSIDRPFDEGGSGSQVGQRGSAGVGEGTNIQPVTEATGIVIKDVAPLQPRRQRKRKIIVADVGGSSHPPKKLREDHGTPSGLSVAEREGGDHIDSMTELDLRTISASQRFIISSDSSYHSGANVAVVEVDSIVRYSVPVMIVVTITTSTADPAVVVKEKTIKPSLFAAYSYSAGRVDPNACFFWILPEVTFLAARQMSLTAEVRMHAEYNIKEKRRLKFAVEEKDELLKAKDKEIENLKTQMVWKETKAAEAIRLRTEASNFVTVEKSLQDDVNVVNERNTILEKERDALDIKVADLEASVVTKEREMTDLNAHLTFVHELEVASFGLQEKLSNYENLMERLKEFQDAQPKVVNDKFDKLYADFVELALHLEERFYSHLFTTIFGRRWLLTHGMELAITKCLHSPEYLSALGTAIGKAIKKGMHDGLSAGITHDAKGRVLTDVSAYNPSAEADYISAVDTGMNILRLEETLAERLRLTGSQPHVDQLMVLIHHSPDQVVVGAYALSLALDVSGTKGTSNVISTTTDTTMALSTTLASASIVAPIFVDNYEVAGTDDQASADGNTDPFPNVDDAELNIPLRFSKMFGLSLRGRYFPSRSLNLYAPFSSAYVTSYGPSHLGPSFLVSSARLASLLRYTRSTSTVLSVGMPISIKITASVPYVNENESWHAFISVLASLCMEGQVPSLRYLKIRVIQVSHSSSTTANISTSLMDFSCKSSSNTCLLKCAKLVEAILLSASAFLFSLLGTCLIENALKLFEDPSVNKIHGLGSSSSMSHPQTGPGRNTCPGA